MKSELELVASQYARATLELALQDKNSSLEGKIGAELTVIKSLVESHPDWQVVLNHPSVPAEEKKQLLLEAFAKQVNNLTMRLLELLNDKGRLELLPQIANQYHFLLNERNQVVTAKLVCSDKLGDSSLADIKARLTEHLGKKLELDVAVDPSLIGGFLLKIGDQVIDGSLKGKLSALEKILISV